MSCTPPCGPGPSFILTKSGSTNYSLNFKGDFFYYGGTCVYTGGSISRQTKNREYDKIRVAFTMGDRIGVTFLDLWRAELHAEKEMGAKLVGLPGSAVALSIPVSQQNVMQQLETKRNHSRVGKAYTAKPTPRRLT